MTRKEATERFNALPKEHRITIIADAFDNEIRFLEREKEAAQKAHLQNIKRLNERIKMLENELKRL